MEDTFSPESQEDQSHLFKEVTIGDKKTHICLVPDCGKEFRFKSDMTRHLAVHSKDRPHTCTFPRCGKTFKRIDTLANHIRSHNNELTFICPIENCGQQFSNKAALKYHTLKHEGQNRFKCSIPGCNRVFITAGQLKQHEKAFFYHQSRGTNTSENNKEDLENGSLEAVKPSLTVKEETLDSESQISGHRSNFSLLSEPYKLMKVEAEAAKIVVNTPTSVNKVDMVQNLGVKIEGSEQSNPLEGLDIDFKLGAMLKSLADENKALKDRLKTKMTVLTNNVSIPQNNSLPANMNIFGLMLARQRLAALQYNMSM